MSNYDSTPPPPPPGDGSYNAGQQGQSGYGQQDGYGQQPGQYGNVPPAAPGMTPAGTGGVAPKNYLPLAILSILCCWPLGIPAIIFSTQVNSKWNAGDAAGAADASAKAKKFATIAIVLGLIATVIQIILMATGNYPQTGTTT
ncbi:MAG: CD225/dispanin family protein [Micrococcales bacterium]|nr:CD225/dispanin family protein [Micrococcales bacterium]